MNYKDIFKRPTKHPQEKQPWYTTWSEGNQYALSANIYMDTIFIASVLGVLFMILLPKLLMNALFLGGIILSPIPLIITAVYYYKNVYHYETSISVYSLKPTFIFIIIYSLLFCVSLTSIITIL